MYTVLRAVSVISRDSAVPTRGGEVVPAAHMDVLEWPAPLGRTPSVEESSRAAFRTGLQQGSFGVWGECGVSVG